MTFQEFYCNKYIYINNYAINFMSKCGCSTLGYYGYIQKYGNTFLRYNEKSIHEYEFKHFKYANIDQSKHGYHKIINQYCLVKYEDIDRNKYKTVAIFRDPIERIISARNPLIDDYKLNNTKEFFDLVIDQYNLGEGNMNQHIMPQYLYYNFDDIDIFIELKDLYKWLNSIGLEPLKLNQTPKDLYKDDPYNNEETFNKYIPILKKLYLNDYILIDKIKNSNKLWKK